MKMSLNISQCNKLFEITEIHYQWLKTHYPDSKVDFGELLKKHSYNLFQYLQINHLNNWENGDIDEKLNKMMEAYSSLNTEEYLFLNKDY